MSVFLVFCRLSSIYYCRLLNPQRFKSLSLRHSPVKTGEFFAILHPLYIAQHFAKRWCGWRINPKNCVMCASPFPSGRGHVAAGSSFFTLTEAHKIQERMGIASHPSLFHQAVFDFAAVKLFQHWLRQEPQEHRRSHSRILYWMPNPSLPRSRANRSFSSWVRK